MTVFTTKKANVSNENDDVEMENRRQMKNWKAIAIIGLILLCVSIVLNIMVLARIGRIPTEDCSYEIRYARSDISDIKSAVYYVDEIKKTVKNIEYSVENIKR